MGDSMTTLTRATGGFTAAVCATLLLASCATAASGGAASAPATSTAVVPDWPSLQAAVAAADAQLRAECATNLAEFGASGDDYAALQALPAADRATELARVGALLGLPAGQAPTVGQVVVVHGCEQGWITGPADCSGIPAG